MLASVKTMNDVNVYMYHEALSELSRAARMFGSAIKHAADTASKLEQSGDDLIAMRTFEECRKAVLEAFAYAPGMIDILTGKAA